MKFDFHLHSHYSDGQLSPTQVIEKCQEAGIEIMSLTDHENVGGIVEAQEAGRRLGVEVIPGIEFDSDWRGEEHHILGYFIDYQSPDLKAFLDKWQKTRMIQLKEIIDNLQQFGFKISLDDVISQARGSIHRSHIARALFQKFEENSAALKEYQVKKRADFFVKFLSDRPGEDGLAYVEREIPQIQEIISLIQGIGGMAFWAHPFWKGEDISKIKEKALYFQKFGLAGIETYYSLNDQERTLALHQLTQNLTMHESGGSDSHGVDSTPRRIGNFQTFNMELNLPFEVRI